MNFIIQPYTIAELAEHYHVSIKIMRRWLTAIQPVIGKRYGSHYTTLQVRQIVAMLGIPGYYTEERLLNSDLTR